MPQTGWLKQGTLIPHSSGGRQVRGQGASSSGVWWDPTSWLVDATFSLGPHVAE